jgi:hypothetical protein
VERRHHQRIRSRAIDRAEVDEPPRREWNLPVVAGCVGALALGLFVWFIVSRLVPDSAEGEDTISGDGATEAETSISAAARQEVVERFLKAGSVEELLEVVDHPEESEPRMREFYEIGGDFHLPMGGRIVDFGPGETDGVVDYKFLVDRIFAVPSIVPVVVGAAQEPKVPWEWVVGWMEKSWQEVLADKPVEPIQVKMFAIIDDYYNYDYLDDEKWQCVKLADRKLENFFYAYLDTSDTGLGEFGQFTAFVPVTIEIKFAPGEQHKQAEIVRLIKVGWMGD